MFTIIIQPLFAIITKKQLRFHLIKYILRKINNKYTIINKINITM